MNATFSVTVGNEVFVYVNGRLVMKRWLDTGVSATFHVAPYGIKCPAPIDQAIKNPLKLAMLPPMFTQRIFRCPDTLYTIHEP